MTHEAVALDDDQVRWIRALAARHGILRIQVFGSRATGHNRPDSDVDLLVDLAPDRDLLDLIAFKQDVEEALGCTADVVTPGGLSPRALAGRLQEGWRRRGTPRAPAMTPGGLPWQRASPQRF
jgi:predicted nucleotidyltransferase